MERTQETDLGLQYVGLSKIDGPLIFAEGLSGVAFDEVVEITDAEGNTRIGRVLEVHKDLAVVQVFEGTQGLSNSQTTLRFTGKGLEIPCSKSMIGRVFDGLGRPKDGLPAPFAEERRDVNGSPINPYSRQYPRDFIQTGISSIDGMNSMVRGQKLPIFSGSGLSHDRIAAQIVRQAKLLSEDVEFTIVFAAMGVKFDVANYFIRNFRESGVLNKVAMFLSLASDPSIERLITPRSALTLAEYLAFDCGIHVLVLLTDITNYAESLREIANVRGEIPGRKGYPGYLYSDLASIYERAGRVKGSEGSITQMSILTMPSDDITHPIPDLSGYITEGQIVLDRDMFQRGKYPPISVLPSLSRLMKDGIGKDRTRADHAHVSSQLFAAYSHVKGVRALASVIGEEELTAVDKVYMEFGRRFENEFVQQSEHEDRSIFDTLDLGWQLLSCLPQNELTRVLAEEIQQYYREDIFKETVKKSGLEKELLRKE